jgi:hypothetical protein
VAAAVAAAGTEAATEAATEVATEATTEVAAEAAQGEAALLAKLRSELASSQAACVALARESAQLREELKRDATTSDAETELMCVVCMDAPKSHAFLECMHKCVCDGCADALARARGAGAARGAECPICRVPGPIRRVYE